MSDVSVGLLAGVGALSFAMSVLLTPLVRSAAIRLGLLDRPNVRSSHGSVIPRGGGVALIVSTAACLVLTRSVWAGTRGGGALLAGAAVIGLVGLYDDRAGLSALPKFLLQLVAAIVCVAGTGGLPRLPLPPPLDAELGLAAAPAGMLWIVVVVNFYNFLDGIDGLAASQGLLTGLGIALAAWDPLAGLLGVSVAAACAGFLVFNWHPARLFLGDAGSGFLGYTFAALPMLAPEPRRVDAVIFVAMSLWLFLADAAWTLGRRLLRGARWHEAHREHLYQLLVIAGRPQPLVVGSIAAGSALMTGAALLAWTHGASSLTWWGVAALGLALSGFELAAVRTARRGARGA
jgi:Fuc2NAc and GlcNAc transferase